MKRSLAKLASGWACWRRVEARGGAMGLGRGQIICAPVVVGVRLPTFPRFYRSLPPVLHHPPISSRTTRFPSASIPPGARLRPSCRSSTPTLAPPVFSASSFNTRVYTSLLRSRRKFKTKQCTLTSIIIFPRNFANSSSTIGPA